MEVTYNLTERECMVACLREKMEFSGETGELDLIMPTFRLIGKVKSNRLGAYDLPFLLQTLYQQNCRAALQLKLRRQCRQNGICGKIGCSCCTPSS